MIKSYIKYPATHDTISPRRNLMRELTRDLGSLEKLRSHEVKYYKINSYKQYSRLEIELLGRRFINSDLNDMSRKISRSDLIRLNTLKNLGTGALDIHPYIVNPEGYCSWHGRLNQINGSLFNYSIIGLRDDYGYLYVDSNCIYITQNGKYIPIAILSTDRYKELVFNYNYNRTIDTKHLHWLINLDEIPEEKKLNSDLSNKDTVLRLLERLKTTWEIDYILADTPIIEDLEDVILPEIKRNPMGLEIKEDNTIFFNLNI